MVSITPRTQDSSLQSRGLHWPSSHQSTLAICKHPREKHTHARTACGQGQASALVTRGENGRKITIVTFAGPWTSNRPPKSHLIIQGTGPLSSPSLAPSPSASSAAGSAPPAAADAMTTAASATASQRFGHMPEIAANPSALVRELGVPHVLHPALRHTWRASR